MDVQDFIAQEGAPSIRLVLNARTGEVVFIDVPTFEVRKEEVLDFCRGLPHVNDGPGWQLLQAYTGGSGFHAKVLIALGDLAGAWKMHPSPLHPDLWHSNLYPMVLAGSVDAPTSLTRVPKPSAGGLDHVASCECCSRPMGPVDSWKHDLVMSAYDESICFQCEEEGCAPPAECRLGYARKEPMGILPSDDPDEVPEGIDEFLGKFGD